ncbi:MAG TPA: transaldolase [Gemmatimonadales bacterium]|nr:transaldolase [Gemmatimonadales bacterium]
MTNPLVRLGELGQSPWYDFITRDLVVSGELARLIAEDGLRGMTSNPTIFEKSIAGSRLYDADIRRLAEEGRGPAAIFEAIAVADVRAACDVFRPLYEASGGRDGMVSIEVSPTLAHDTEGTIAEAERLWGAIDRPNAMIKIPGTLAGLPAITHCIARGINVNVTLLFAVERYRAVIDAYLAGLEQRAARGLRLDRVTSVASFFVSRVDSKVDPLLDRLADSGAGERAAALRSRAAIANACLAYRAFEASLAGERWTRLRALGAAAQRPLWASTSTKDPRLPDTYYVEALIAPETVNTLPPETFAAYRDHGAPAVRIRAGIEAAPAVLDGLAGLGVSLDAVTRELEEEGVAKFAASYRSLLEGLEAKVGVLSA